MKLKLEIKLKLDLEEKIRFIVVSFRRLNCINDFVSNIPIHMTIRNRMLFVKF